MGRGKKKGGKKAEEEPTLSSLTISEERPSTSQASQPPSTALVEEVADSGGGPDAKSKSDESAAKTQPEKVTAVTSVTTEAADDDECGLGLGGGKKKPRRKKKPAGGAQPTSDQPQPTPTVSSGPPAQPPLAGPPAQPPLAGPPAQPRFAGPRAQPPFAGPPAQPPFAGPPAQPPFAGPPAQPPFAGPPAKAPLGPAPPAQSLPVISPVSGPPIAAQQIAAPSSTPAWTQPAVPGQGRGRGRGSWAPATPVPIVPHPPVVSGDQRGHGQRPAYSEQQGPSKEPSQPPQVPSPARKQATDNIICRFRIPDKIDTNVPGRRCRLITNYLPMTIKPLKIFRYDVQFKPDRPKKFLPRAYNLAMSKHFPQQIAAFDQMKNCYCLQQLKNVPQTGDRYAMTVEFPDDNGAPIKMEITLKATGVVDLNKILLYMSTGGTSLSPPTEEIQCIDVILRHGTLESYVKAGRQFFKRPANPIDLGDGLEMWTGLFQSAIFTSRPFINIDVAHKGFPKHQPLINAIVNDFQMDLSRPLTRQGFNTETFLAFIKGLRVTATLLADKSGPTRKREFICNTLVEEASKLKFKYTDDSGRQTDITVADFFARVKGYRLKYPNLNCMWVGPKDKNIFYPLELLDIVYGQARNRQLNEKQLSKMVREAASPPADRKRKIEEIIYDMNYSRNQYFKKFGLEISDSFYQVDAKILQPPKLDIGRGFVEPRKGVWQANSLLSAVQLRSWSIVAIEMPGCDFENIISMIMRTCSQMGIVADKPIPITKSVSMDANSPYNLKQVLHEALKKGIKMLFVVVSTRGRDYYHRVKKMAEREVGILTQCLKDRTARTMNPQTVRNILLKVNSKLMGVNQALNESSVPKCLKGGGVMVVGADVTHPSPEQTSIPSLAAVTASIDPKCYMYNLEMSVQAPKREMIVQLEDMMVDHFRAYQNHQKSLPHKIFVFRDGVSEGQFAQVLNSELTAIHRAYARVKGGNAKPEVLFLLVQKRHHTRFFLERTPQYNVEPGTVVDKDIVHVRELDFYMVSHQAIKGTARPTRYHAICNDGRIPVDEVEHLTYYLCHLFSRCTRAVSYPTPTYYAHLACLRARSLTFGDKFDNQDLETNPQRLRVHNNVLNLSKMFYV